MRARHSLLMDITIGPFIFPRQDCPVRFAEMTNMLKHYADYRPLIHYSVPEGWMNDPNGLIYYDGYYHLFYQHYPGDIKFGPMHWGHARSRDLIVWEQLPVALYPDDLGVIYSGSAVVDYENISGLGTGGKPPLITFFTHDNKGVQYQSVAYSNDGIHFEKYARNPVVVNEAERNFRDPKVFWHDESGAYVMVIAAGQKLMFYHSENLLEWGYSGMFAGDAINQGSVFECPDMIRFSSRGVSKWVLLFSLTCTSDTDWRMRYLSGDFDGKTFVPDGADRILHAADDGIDHYAAVTFHGLPDGRTILLGWMNYWGYADKIPATAFRGSMTLPREISLVNTSKGLRLAQTPVREVFETFHERESIDEIRKGPLSLPLKTVPFAVKLTAVAQDFTIVFHNNADRLIVLYDAEKNTICCDRSQCGIAGFSPKYSQAIESRIENQTDKIDLVMIVDITSIELFACGGKNVITAQLFMQKPFTEFVVSDGCVMKALEFLF